MGSAETGNILKEISSSCWAEILSSSFEGTFLIDREKNIIFWNKSAENISGYPSSETVGRKCWDKLLLPIDDQGRPICSESCPVNNIQPDTPNQILELYIHHREGYRLPVLMKVVPLKSHVDKLIGTTHIFIDISPRLSMPPRTDELDRLDLVDPLTSIGNRNFLKIYLKSRLQEMQKFGLNFGVLFIDIDRLAEINNLYGHSTGDRLIAAIARTFLNNLRFIDVIGRWDDDAFLAIITNVNEVKLDLVANKLRLLAQNSFIFTNGLSVSTTVSIGGTMARKRDTFKEIIDRAEKLMLHSKWLGRNRVCLRLS